MKKLSGYMGVLLFSLLPALAFSHPGHGVPGSVGHELQHQFWIFAGMVVVAALMLLLQSCNEKQD